MLERQQRQQWGNFQWNFKLVVANMDFSIFAYITVSFNRRTYEDGWNGFNDQREHSKNVIYERNCWNRTYADPFCRWIATNIATLNEIWMICFHTQLCKTKSRHSAKQHSLAFCFLWDLLRLYLKMLTLTSLITSLLTRRFFVVCVLHLTFEICASKF